MIARILIALEKQKTRQQLKKLLSRPDVIVEFPSSRANLWERIGRETCDLVVVGRPLIPEPTADSLSRYKGLSFPFLRVHRPGRLQQREPDGSTATGEDESR